jgi:hypothetical protein
LLLSRRALVAAAGARVRDNDRSPALGHRRQPHTGPLLDTLKRGIRMDSPETRYAKSGAIDIAYQVHGSGPIDLFGS